MALKQFFLLIILLFFSLCFGFPCFGYDLGVYGETWEIEERDMREAIAAEARTVNWQSLGQSLGLQARQFGEYLPLVHLPEAKATQTTFINPAIALAHDIARYGQVFYHKGTWVNPLHILRPVTRLLFFNAEIPGQKQFALAALKAYPGQIVLVTTQGNPLPLSQIIHHPVYYAFPELIKRFHIQATPSLLGVGELHSQHSDELAITSIVKPYSLKQLNLSPIASGYTGHFPNENCKGRLLNPVTDINWNMIFPIHIAGVKATAGQSSTDSSATVTSSLCVCPSGFGHLPSPGILVTYHQPLYVEEIAKTPGCLSSLGGLSILKGYENLQTDLKQDSNNAARWQVHWYQYPVLGMLSLFKDFLCGGKSNGAFSLAYMTELDPTWQDDTWAALYAPEAALFTSPAAQAACATDAIAATASHPLDKLFWCAGSWGPLYPLTGNANASVEHIQSANLVGAKMLAKLAKMGVLRSRVGPSAICESQPMPTLIKSEFSLDPVYPHISNEGGMSIGASTAVWEYAPSQSYPGYENINQVIFQEQQCCLHF